MQGQEFPNTLEAGREFQGPQYPEMGLKWDGALGVDGKSPNGVAQVRDHLVQV